MRHSRRMANWALAVVFGLQLICPTAGQCTFPTELEGNWLSSKKGGLTITNDTISGFSLCEVTVGSCEWLPSELECIEKSENQYLVRTPVYIDSGRDVVQYACLYLARINEAQYIYYQGPTDKHGFLKDYAKGALASTIPTMAEVCNLPTPLPVTRYNVLVKSDSMAKAVSPCPGDFVGNYLSTSNETCILEFDETGIQVRGSGCSQDALFTANGSLVCIHALSGLYGSCVTYLTLYNEDTTVDNINTFQFTCLAIATGNSSEVYIRQQARDCDDLWTPDASNADFIGHIQGQVKKPPPTAPVVSARSHQHGEELVQGDDVTVTCHVSGGIPPANAVTLTCEEETVTGSAIDSQGKAVVSLEFPDISARYNLTDCTCRAAHVTGCYVLTGSLQLHILVGPYHEDEPSGVNVGAVVGGICAAVIGAGVIIGVAIFFVRRQKRKQDDRSGDKDQNITPQDSRAVCLDLTNPAFALQDENATRSSLHDGKETPANENDGASTQMSHVSESENEPSLSPGETQTQLYANVHN